MRSKLSGLLDVPRSYDLDRLDLRAGSSLDGAAQRAATQLLRSLKIPPAAKAAGLYGFHLLNEGDDPSKLVFSFTLFERGERANLLRVQTDNHDQPFDINEGARLDLGSTAKLRTLITYLELVAELHGRWSGLGTSSSPRSDRRRDPIGRWAREYLRAGRRPRAWRRCSKRRCSVPTPRTRAKASSPAAGCITSRTSSRRTTAA